MEIEAACKCGHTVRVKDPFEGMVVLCTQCGGPMAVPRPLPGEGGARVSATPTRTRRRRFQTDPPWVLPLVAGLVLLGIAGGAAAWRQGWLTSEPAPPAVPRARTAAAPGSERPPIIEDPPEVRPPDLPLRPGFIRPGRNPDPEPSVPPDAAGSGDAETTGAGKAVPGSSAPTPASPAAGRRVVSSKKSTKYHRPDCEWALKISGDNRVEYDSPGDAERADLKPCGVCRPERE